MARMGKYEIDMVDGPIAGGILRFVIPMFIASLTSQMFNAADIIVVGKFVGDTAQAAVTSSSPLVSLLGNLYLGLSAGASIVVARALGKGERSAISTVVHTSIAMALVLGLFIGFLGELATPLFLQLLSVPEGVKGQAALYLRLDMLGMPASALSAFASAQLRAQGDTKRPMYYALFSGAVNVVLNLIFVLGFRWDVAGVALATVISKYLSAGLVLHCLRCDGGVMHLEWRKLKIDFAEMKEIVRIGVPAGLQAILFTMSNVVVQSGVNSMGEVAMAGSGAAANIGAFVANIGAAFYHSSMTFTAQNRGAGKTERIDRVLKWNLLFVLLLSTAVSSVAYLFGPSLLGIYTNSADVIRMGMVRLRWVCVPYGIYGGIQVFSGAMRALGYSVYPTVVTLFGNCALRALWVATVFAAIGTPDSLFFGFPVTWGITLVTFAISFLVIRPKAYAKIRAASEGQANDE